MRSILLFTAAAVLASGTAARAEDSPDKAAAKAAKADAKAEQRRLRDRERLYGQGPFPEETEAFVAGRPEALRPLYKTLFVGGERNAVLNFQRLGLQAMALGQWREAEWAFDKALDRIEAIYANNPQANAARSVFHNEANKDYKGEPYERSMAYYYRGLLFLRAGDYGNARATFKSAEFQDTLSEAESFQSDFAIMNYLIGWTQQCEGQASSAKESFDIAAKTEPALKPPAPGDNVLFLAELGNGPAKARDGASAQKLVFQAGPAYPENAAAVAVSYAAPAPRRAVKGRKRASPVAGGKPLKLDLVGASSVYFQATTRGGRPIDGILQGKATLKETTGGVGGALIEGGVASALTSGDMTQLGIGAALSLFSKTVKTKADIRAWDGLPDLMLLRTAKVAAADWNYEITYRNGEEAVTTAGPTMRGLNKACSLVWARSRPVSFPEAIPGEDDGVALAVNRKGPMQQRNKLFRTALVADLGTQQASLATAIPASRSSTQ